MSYYQLQPLLDAYETCEALPPPSAYPENFEDTVRIDIAADIRRLPDAHMIEETQILDSNTSIKDSCALHPVVPITWLIAVQVVGAALMVVTATATSCS